jgi:hypothetical protein
MLAERLFLHVLAGTRPAEQFAGHSLRRFYNLWRARVALLAGGTAICAILLLVSGLRFLDVSKTTGDTAADRQQAATVAGQYDRLQARFPKTPVPREALNAAVESADAIVRQTVFPDRFFAEISQALSATPQIEFDKIEWDISNDPRSRVRAAAVASKSAKAPAAPKAAAKTNGGGAYFEVAVISAHIKAVKASDYRSIKIVVDRFVQELQRRPGLEVLDTRTPFDTITEKAVAGDASARESDEVPQFTVTVTRRISA